jgi:hypothetical protein
LESDEGKLGAVDVERRKGYVARDELDQGPNNPGRGARKGVSDLSAETG